MIGRFSSFSAAEEPLPCWHASVSNPFERTTSPSRLPLADLLEGAEDIAPRSRPLEIRSSSRFRRPSDYDLVLHGSMPRPAMPRSISEPALAAMRLARCDLVETNDLAKLASLVPGIANVASEAHIAFDLDDTLITGAPNPTSHAQPTTLSNVRDLQLYHNCFGLTARPFDQSIITWLDLTRLGFDLAESAPWHETGSNAGPTLQLPSPGQRDVGYLGGVIYAGSLGKGALLKSICHSTPGLKHLVFIDDQVPNFVSMLRAVADLPDAPKVTCVWFNAIKGRSAAGSLLWEGLERCLERQNVPQIVAWDSKYHQPRGGLNLRPDSWTQAGRLLARRLDTERGRPAAWLEGYLADVSGMGDETLDAYARRGAQPILDEAAALLANDPGIPDLI